MRHRTRVKKILAGDEQVLREEDEAYARWEAGLTSEKPLILRLAEELEIPREEFVEAMRQSREGTP